MHIKLAGCSIRSEGLRWFVHLRRNEGSEAHESCSDGSTKPLSLEQPKEDMEVVCVKEL